MRNTAIILGGLASMAIGYGIFKVTGLYDACESSIVKYALGFLIMAVYLIGFRSGLSGRSEKIEEEATQLKTERREHTITEVEVRDDAEPSFPYFSRELSEDRGA